MPTQDEPNNFVRNFAIVASIITGIIVLALLLPDLCRDRWEENNTSIVHDKIKKADKLSGSDFMAAFKIYEEVVSEASKHTIKNDTFRQELDVAKGNRDKLFPRVQEVRREEAEKNRLALQEQRRQEQRRQEQRRQEQEQSGKGGGMMGTCLWIIGGVLVGLFVIGAISELFDPSTPSTPSTRFSNEDEDEDEEEDDDGYEAGYEDACEDAAQDRWYKYIFFLGVADYYRHRK